MFPCGTLRSDDGCVFKFCAVGCASQTVRPMTRNAGSWRSGNGRQVLTATTPGLHPDSGQWLNTVRMDLKHFMMCATWGIPGLAALAGVAVFYAWLRHDPAADAVLLVPGLDGAPETQRVMPEVRIGDYFAQGDGVAADIPGAWPWFRGGGHDNISREPVALADRWEAAQPRTLWSIAVGEGHAGAAIRNGRVYLLDYDETLRADMLRCLSLADGREIWRRGYAVAIQRNHGMSRTVPAVTDRHVVTIGPKGHVMCVDAETGDFRWGMDLARDYGTAIPMWYAGQCPLIADGVAILAPAGETVLMMGVDCETGAIRWQTPNPDRLEMSHASIVPASFDGVRMYVYAAVGGLVGIGAEGDDLGRVLWQAPDWDRSVMVPSPVVFDDGRIFVTAGYGGGSMLLQVVRDNGNFVVQPIQTFRASQGLASEQQTPVWYDDHLFGILPNDAGPMRNQLVAVRPSDPGTFVWASGRENRFGLGPYLVADGKLYVLSDDGVLTMLKATGEGYRELGRRRILDGHDAWAPMALANGFLVLRDDTRMVCVDLRADGTAE